VSRHPSSRQKKIRGGEFDQSTFIYIYGNNITKKNSFVQLIYANKKGKKDRVTSSFWEHLTFF
jgi:hypothetical protein